jgi:hypothetical protein
MSARTARIAAFSALFLVSVLITLVVLLSGRERVPVEPQGGEVWGPSARQLIDEFAMSAAPARRAENTLGVEDFILPEPVEGDSGQPYLLRPRLDRWGEEQVNRHWIPLEDIALDLVRRENDRRIEELFEGIP